MSEKILLSLCGRQRQRRVPDSHAVAAGYPPRDRKTFWHVHDLPNMPLEQMRKYHSRPGNKQVKRCLKNAARSGYHLTKEQAMQAFIYRKAFQLNRIWLTAETVELCLKGLQEAGHVRNVSLDNGLQINRRGEVISVPNGEFLAAKQPGPIASNYSWGEY